MSVKHATDSRKVNDVVTVAATYLRLNGLGMLATRAPREGYSSGEKVELRGYSGLRLSDPFYGDL